MILSLRFYQILFGDLTSGKVVDKYRDLSCLFLSRDLRQEFQMRIQNTIKYGTFSILVHG